MIFTQFVDGGLGCASYLVGDENAGVAAIVDPAYAIEQYLEESGRRDARIVRVLETHTHADHVSGHGRLALDHGCSVAIHAAADAAYEHERLAEGDEIELGDVVLRVLHTPGHRPEHSAFAVVDRSRAEMPWLVLTGDSLFVGDVARPDLAVEGREGAAGLFDSLRRLVALGDGVEVFPGHVAGSLCGAGMSSKASTTIGFERQFNKALQIAAPDSFVDAYGSATQVRPPNMHRIVALNSGQFRGAPAPLRRVDAVDGATVLDVRDADAFARGHARGALNVPVDVSMFSTKAGFLFEPEERIVIHAASAAQAEAAARGLRAVAVFELVGFVDDPPQDELVEAVGIDELPSLLDRGAVEVLDVREKDERDEAYIPGTRHVPYRLLRRMSGDLHGGRPVVTICSTGARAGIAASVLAAAGVAARPVLDGGIASWRGQTVEFRRCGG